MSAREVLHETKAIWRVKALKKLDEIGRLQENWDSYGGLPLKPEVREAAIRLLHKIGATELPVPGVVLGSAGTVQFEWQANGRELEVEVLADGRIGFLKVWEGSQMEEGELESSSDPGVGRLIDWLLNGT